MDFKKILIIVFSILPLIVCAQEKHIVQQLQEDEQDAIKAISLYPEKERAIILEVASQPEILVRIKNIRRKTESQFQELLKNLPENDQKKIYNLSRYPELIKKICQENKKKSSQQMEELLKEYPEEVHQHAAFINERYFDLIVSINILHHTSQQEFENILNDYPEQIRRAYQELIKLPEVINILTENMNMTILLGDKYKKHPTQLKNELDSLNIVLAEQKTKELNDWKQNLEENPEAMTEYENASQEFAREQGYDESNYKESTTEVYVNHVWRPYPYWFGWPWWYSYESWYPYPWWYHRGYYYGTGNTVVFIGLPSNFFVHWHFNRYSNFYHYPHFTNHVVNYYYGHRKLNTNITPVVRKWEKENKSQLPKNWLSNSKNRVKRIKEYGRFNMNYQTTIRKGNNKLPSQREYLKSNAKHYPTLKPVLKEQQKTYQPPRMERRVEQKRDYQPSKYLPKKKVIEKRPSNYQKINRAKDYHQNTWQRPKIQPKKRIPVKQPVPLRKQRYSPPRRTVQPKRK